jgi:protein associated with RNAse G/E
MGKKTKIYDTDSLKDGEVKLKYQEDISKDLQESETRICINIQNMEQRKDARRVVNSCNMLYA